MLICIWKSFQQRSRACTPISLQFISLAEAETVSAVSHVSHCIAHWTDGTIPDTSLNVYVVLMEVFFTCL
jgi:hypothetical protein